MTKRLFILIPLLMGLSIPLFSIGSKEQNSNNGGVFICEDNGEKGPIFYPASYDSEISDEPNYSLQKNYTFDSMNYVATPTYYRGDSVKVAVIDSGLNYTHEDFIDINNNQIIQGESRTIDNKSGSWLYYQFNSGYQTRINDTLGHGTNVASVIASQINSIGCAGLAPNVELYVYKVTNDSNGYEWTAINSALQYCIDEGMDVVNMSFQAYEHAVSYNSSSMAASTGCSSIMTTMINKCYNAGITLVAAAGNFNTSEPSYPASNNHVISVGSLAESSTTTKAGFSNTYGIDIVAPGYVYVADKGNSNAYKKTQGTSFSAPIVTAAIALYKQKYPSATPAQIEQALYDSCDSIAGNPSWAGNGRLNIDRFLDVSTGMPSEINWTNVTNDSLTLTVGDTYQLECEVLPEDTINKTVHYQVDNDWGDDGVVTVTDGGLITATGVGTAYIEVYSDEITSVNNYVEVTVTGPVTLSSITVKTPPTKTNYIEGQYFDPTGLVITLNYSDSTHEDIDYASHSGDFSFNPSLSTALTTSKNSVTITYGDKSVSQSISVSAKALSSISISGQTTSFVEGDTFSFGGIVTAYYDNGTQSDVTSSATFSGYNMTSVGNQTVTVSYTYKGVTRSLTYSITISVGTLSGISLSGQTTTFTKNSAFSFDGICTATFANGYQKVVTPTSISSPDMSTTGVKTITISYTYNGVTKTATYDITVNYYRVVMENQTNETTLGTVTYPNNTETISVNTISTSSGGSTAIESNAFKMGSNGNTGSLIIASTSSNIYRVVASIKSYGSDSSVHITIGGDDKTITSNYVDYEKTYTTPTNSVTISTIANKKRAYVQSVILYTKTTTPVDIGQSDDCVGLETFISTYMHMDYTDNLGYCKDNTHHYYSSAKEAFNGLNDHQRSLFVNNTAYKAEYDRLSRWAEFNNETLNTTTNKYDSNALVVINNNKTNYVPYILIVVSITSISFMGYFLLNKKKKREQ